MKNMISAMLPIFFLAACSDFLEEDISRGEVSKIAPTDHVTLQQSAVTFVWEPLEGATSYRLQVVTPSFDSTTNVMADLEVEGETSAEVVLPIGHYQWRVVGKNFGYETVGQEAFDLFIESDTAMNLGFSILVLTEPGVGEETNEQVVGFKWHPLALATGYNFQLASPDFSNNAYIISNELVGTTSLSKALNEGTYRWRVRGQNNSSVSPFSERAFTVDRTAPGQPVLGSPPNGEIVDIPVQLEWSSDEQSIGDSLFVYKDSLGANQVLKVFLTGKSYQFNDAGSPQYFWRVRTVDKAGNVSVFSELRSFIRG
jgi:hypothetical protein